MKKIILLSLFILLLSPSFAQSICGTTAASSYIPNTSVNQSTTWINVYYHIVQKTNGTGGISTNQLCGITTLLNSYYNQYGIFINSSGYDFVKNDSYYDLGNGVNGIFNANSQANAINIYIINTFVPGGIGGCAQSIPSKAFWILSNNTTSSAVSHEMGHCLGLFHTHRSSSLGLEASVGCQENVTGSNCSSCGDFICDTPADPYLLGRMDYSTCQYTGYDLQNGTPYNPAITNLMSYGFNCSNKFSPMQVYAMKNTLYNNTVGVGAVRNTTLATTSMNGNSSICSSATFTLSNIRSGFYLSGWSSSNTAVATVNGSGTVSKVSDGSTTITATLTDGCQSYYVSKTIVVGIGGIGGTYTYGWNTFPIMGSTSIAVSNTSNTISFNLTNQWDPATTYSWVTNSQSGTVSKTFSGKTATVTLSSGSSINFTANANNTCGSTSTSFSCYNYSSYSMVASPNPASQTLTIKAALVDVTANVATLNANEKLLTIADINSIPISLIDKNGRVVSSGKLTNEGITFSLDKIPNGTYFLHIAEGKDLIEKKIFIQH